MQTTSITSTMKTTRLSYIQTLIQDLEEKKQAFGRIDNATKSEWSDYALASRFARDRAEPSYKKYEALFNKREASAALVWEAAEQILKAADRYRSETGEYITTPYEVDHVLLIERRGHPNSLVMGEECLLCKANKKHK